MPQMSPLLWSYLFLTFSLLLLISLIKIYFFSFSSISPGKSGLDLNKSNSMTWMW
uniref:ATP synthase complex subunit 8 n=1 Tax=Sinella curviseta TaxID=187695 RepID=A0A4P6DC75_9HEXA|nr:ATP synthase F0 subunit 8 [Sinella curviseta]QAU56469.1 ATP synthase F0 subunit 8 [Sinella curviseta]